MQLVPATSSSTARLRQPGLRLPAELVDKAVSRLCVISVIAAVSAVVFWRGIDQGVIDATLDGSADGARELSDSVRHMQSGNLRSYAAWIAIGAAAVIAYMVWVATR